MPRTRTPEYSSEVTAWFDGSDHPLQDVMQEVRDTMLLADARVTECIKWKSPTFVYDGNIASMTRAPVASCS